MGAGLRVRLTASDPLQKFYLFIQIRQVSQLRNHRQQTTIYRDPQATESRPREEFEERLKRARGQLLLRNCALNRFQRSPVLETQKF